jgi:predicted CoA-binding protein
MDPINLARARKFLREPRIALVGVSRDAKDFSRVVFRELAKRGIDVVPVNPAVAEVEGRACFPRLSDVEPPVRAALLMTPPAQTGHVLDDCVEAGVERVWFHRGAGSGSGDATALAFCERHGIEAVRDLCPFMALPNAGFAHALHGFFRRRLS